MRQFRESSCYKEWNSQWGIVDLQLCDADDAAAESAARVARRLAQLVAALAEVVLEGNNSNVQTYDYRIYQAESQP